MKKRKKEIIPLADTERCLTSLGGYNLGILGYGAPKPSLRITVFGYAFVPTLEYNGFRHEA